MNLHPCPLCGESKGYDKSWNSSELFCRACCRRVAINNAVAAKLRQTDDAAWNAAAAHAQGLREREQRTASYATALAFSLHAQHFSEVTQWKPLPDTLGLLTQIDNMVVGLRERIAELERDNANLKTVMVAAAEEIHAHWDAHCDAEGYGPQNLMRRLEEGIPSEYGYTAGAFAARQKRIAELEAQRGPLTDEQMLACARAVGLPTPRGLIRAVGPYEVSEPTHFLQELVHAVERAHGIEEVKR